MEIAPSRVSITGYPILFLETGPGPGLTGSQIPRPGTGTGWEPVPRQVPGSLASSTVGPIWLLG